ncbi:transmembrane protein 229b-like [Gigantopelta aegis]|uniref:transmembrane protein 229b-like n=1 Tax=Gigantopelta aegis TaxID=1735272 RepID=UPI001B889B31|nr:transmembrane protein 229b-like [Gigantopelta aegis]
MTQQHVQPLSALGRFYIYAIHGYATEVMFTAIWEFAVNQNWKFPGNTSVWSFPIYGLSLCMLEQLYLHMKDRIHILGRAVVYMLSTYIMEFSTGYILKKFDACPWDYTPFEGDFMGLITLEYAPLWFIGGIVVEKFVIRYTRHMYWGPPVEELPVMSRLLNGEIKAKHM